MTGKVQVFGLLGEGIARSLSPAMQNAAFKEKRIPAVYTLFDLPPSQLKEAMEGIRALGIAGGNLTMPHKVGVLEHLDRVEKMAREIGAVNTFANRKGKLAGTNTDGKGLVEALREGKVELQDAWVVLAGCGGAGRAVAFALLEEKIEGVCLFDAKPERALALQERLLESSQSKGKAISAVAAKERLQEAVGEAEVVVNCSNAGMRGTGGMPVPLNALHAGQAVMDIVYNPRETRLVLAARRKGCNVLTGERMLLHQGALAFEFWTGEKAPLEAMREALRKGMGR